MATLKDQLERAKGQLNQAENIRNQARSLRNDTRYIKFKDRPVSEQEEINAKITEASAKYNIAKTYYNNILQAYNQEQQNKKITGETEGLSEKDQAADLGITVEKLRANKQAALDADRAAKDAANKGATNQQSVSDYGQLLNTIAADETELKSIQEDLKKNFSKLYKGEVSGLKDWIRTQAALETIFEQRRELPKSLQGASLREFLLNPTIDITAGAKGAGGPQLKITISSPTEAASTIQSVFKNTLNRDATLEEIAKFTTVLNKAERNAGRKTKTSGGRTEYTTDLDRVQFLTEEVKKIKDPKTGKSEFETKRGEKESLTSQNLVSVASLNGIDLSPDQLNSYLTDIRNGKDINVIKNQIRSIAGLGMPDNVKKLLNEGINLETIYAPYKNLMASTLELNPESIDLKDPTLRLAFGPDKETTIYDFEKALRKDPRWQYTKNAKKAVANSTLRILQDFGVQA
jgi:hypothetical protein